MTHLLRAPVSSSSFWWPLSLKRYSRILTGAAFWYLYLVSKHNPPQNIPLPVSRYIIAWWDNSCVCLFPIHLMFVTCSQNSLFLMSSYSSGWSQRRASPYSLNHSLARVQTHSRGCIPSRRTRFFISQSTYSLWPHPSIGSECIGTFHELRAVCLMSIKNACVGCVHDVTCIYPTLRNGQTEFNLATHHSRSPRTFSPESRICEILFINHLVSAMVFGWFLEFG